MKLTSNSFITIPYYNSELEKIRKAMNRRRFPSNFIELQYFNHRTQTWCIASTRITQFPAIIKSTEQVYRLKTKPF